METSATYLAHKDGERVQTVLEHLSGTAELAGQFAAAFGAGDEGRFCAMLHDVGKYSDAFQKRLDGSGMLVDHSTAGALEARKHRNIPAAFCIAGHHSGLPNGGSRLDDRESATLMARFLRVPGVHIENYSAFAGEVQIPDAEIPMELCRDRQSALFFIRMLYSSLVDADWLDTQRFMSGGSVERGNFPPLRDYREKLQTKIAPWLSAPKGGMGQRRSEILRAALGGGALPPGLFTLTAPTGSGKTVASMAFALEHAVKNNLRRVIYVIPYCSIIEQTLGVFEEIFGAGNVVAHYSDAMCSLDRRKKLDEIRRKLTAGAPCRVISTSLVEAGVDVDFPVVYRALAGLDSVVQAGGRCNREGKREAAQSWVYIFESDRPAPRMLEQNISAARFALDRHADPASPEAVRAYFRELLYVDKGLEALDAAEILKLSEGDDRPFATIAERFHIIDNAQYTVYIPKAENKALLERLTRFGPSRALMRELGQYAVGVYPQHYFELGGAVEPIRGMDGAAILQDESLYSEDTGLTLTIAEGRELFV